MMADDVPGSDSGVSGPASSTASAEQANKLAGPATPLDRDNYRSLRLLVFSLGAGGLLGCLAYAAALPFYAALGIGGMWLAALFGLGIGFCCSPFVILLLAGRALPIVRPLVLWPTALIVVALAAYLPERAIFHLMGVAPGVFVVACVIVRVTVPRTWNKPGLCRFCGFDVRGSLEFGRCPECGHRFDERPWFLRCATGSGWRAALVRIAAFLVRHPTLPIVAVVAILLLPRACFDCRRSARERVVVGALDAACERGGTFELRAHTPFGWDTVYIVPPYTGCSQVEDLLGFPWPECERTGIEMDEVRNLLVFLCDGAFVEYLKIPRRADFSDDTHMRPWRADEAVFQPHAMNGGRYELRPADPGP